MSQQQHPRLRPVPLPDFPLCTESPVNDIKTGYRSYSRVRVEDHARREFGLGEDQRTVSSKPVSPYKPILLTKSIT